MGARAASLARRTADACSRRVSGCIVLAALAFTTLDVLGLLP